jgi:hypothetical protein
MSETSSLSALCQFEKTGVGATLMGRPIRFDEASGLLSVKDVIEVIKRKAYNPTPQERRSNGSSTMISYLKAQTTGLQNSKSENTSTSIFLFFTCDKIVPRPHT